MKTNCCIANGPRGFVALMESLLMAADDTVMINLYHNSKASIQIPNTQNIVAVTQTTEYPEKDLINIAVDPMHPAEFTLKLRIPAWSTKNALSVNGEPISPLTPGCYASVRRAWKAGDKIELRIDLSCRKEILNNHFVLMRGPVTLARDTRFADGNIHEVVTLQHSKPPITLKPAKAKDKSIWMTFTTELQEGLNLEDKKSRVPRTVHFCDFASAGNTWDNESLYRVWQRSAINVMHQPYVPYNPPANSEQ
jgi:hypothetical protein